MSDLTCWLVASRGARGQVLEGPRPLASRNEGKVRETQAAKKSRPHAGSVTGMTLLSVPSLSTGSVSTVPSSVTASEDVFSGTDMEGNLVAPGGTARTSERRSHPDGIFASTFGVIFCLHKRLASRQFPPQSKHGHGRHWKVKEQS